ncbi:glycoside hydrolase family 16 protein [Noviherbaspirillum cavernae]|uniref:Glycoside hydrolase family 16 protein n=2 Tax=Noviherbaspirillum cavernae TaxID=2320862 RepID=A0A418X6B2_9BURK|nr:glycoside hydrolase family 16 protein [Noviherbaspirillum cavernae]
MVTTSPKSAAPPSGRAAGKTAVGPYGQNTAKYRLTFSEEFDGDRLDTRIWNDREWYDPSFPTINYAVEGGSLKIWPQRDANGNFFKRVINTDEKFYQQYGYFEMEARLPYGKGVWPAFWLYNHDHKEHFRPEIDIMEAYPGGGPGSGWSGANLRPTAYAITIWSGEPEVQGGYKMLEDMGDLSAKFHKYAVKWEPHKQTFYFDGKEVYSAKVSMPDRMYLLLDILFGSASGEPDDTTPTGKGNAFEIRYVRAWQFR